MFFYRIKQFIWSVNTHISEEDIKYTEKILKIDELKLFNKLAKNEQKHCIRVSRDVGRFLHSKGLKNDILIRVALLHDIGKIQKRVNIINKSIIVILNKLTKGKLKRFNNIKDINIYYNHGQIGAKILEKYDHDNKELYLIANHHNDSILSDSDLNILRYFDDKN